MTRVEQGYIARRRRNKIRLFGSSFRGALSRPTRTIAQRIKSNRSCCHLWITRINAAIRQKGGIL